MATLLADKYAARKAEVNERFEQLRANEEELNRIFAEIYNMVGEVPIEVEDKYVSVARIFDTAEEIPESYKGNKYVRTKRDEITSLISYAVGCMFGRYSLDVDGLVLADQGDTVEDYLQKMPDPASVSFHARRRQRHPHHRRGVLRRRHRGPLRGIHARCLRCRDA